jgi:hypothetical protein
MIIMKNALELSEPAKGILKRIQNGEETKEGKGMAVVRGFPSNNEATYCVFNLRGGGSALPLKRAEFSAALSELIEAGFIFELSRENTQTRYKLVEQKP